MLRICLSSVSVDLRAYKKNFCCITLTLQLKWPPRWNQSKLPQIVQDGHLKRQLAELVPNLLYQNSFCSFGQSSFLSPETRTSPFLLAASVLLQLKVQDRKSGV